MITVWPGTASRLGSDGLNFCFSGGDCGLMFLSKLYVLTEVSIGGSGGCANDTGDGDRCGGGVDGERCVSRRLVSCMVLDE